MPRVSICIPSYNSARFLGAAIESSLAQTFVDFELVVSDNASTDETKALCQRYTDPRLKYHRFETLVGQGANWNRCVSLAVGDFIALLHADDEYLPDFLARRLGQFRDSPETGIAFGAVELIDEDGRSVGRSSFGNQAIAAAAPTFYENLLMGCIINPASLMVRRSCYATAGPFDEDRLWGVDWDMWLRIAAMNAVSYTPAVSSRYRIHGSSGSSTGLLGSRYLSDDLAVLRAALRRLDLQPNLTPARAMRGKALRAYSLRALSAAEANCVGGRRASTIRAVATAIRYSPVLLTRPTLWALVAASVAGPGVYRVWKRLRGPRPDTEVTETRR